MTIRRTSLDLFTSRVTIGTIAILLGISLTACGGNSDGASGTMAPGDSSTPWPTETDGEIPIENPAPTPVAEETDAKALADFQSALDLSSNTAKATGLTEVWDDSEGVTSLIVVWDTKNKQSVSLDVELNSAEVGEFEYMTPAIAQGDLDSITKGENEGGFINYTSDKAFFIKTNIDGEEYVTTYTLDSSGQLATAKTYVGGDLLGSVTFSYSITAEGQKALDSVK